MNLRFSVLMSLYEKEKPAYLRECMESLIHQTLLPSEIVVVEDGALTLELDAVLDEYEKNESRIPLCRVRLPENRGLGLALAEGIRHCSYPLVARMDSDDISVPDRFRLQIRAFAAHPGLDVVGGMIAEFSTDPKHADAVRKVPLATREIYQYQRRRDALNHVSVMFKKEAVLKAGNYQDALLMEDSLLWAHMIRDHARMINLPEVLVYVRTGEDMLKRRGGFSYFKKYRSGRKKILQTGTISRWDYLFTVCVQFVVCMMPLPLRKFVFRKILRN